MGRTWVILLALVCWTSHSLADEALASRYYNGVFSGDVSWMVNVDAVEHAGDPVFKGFKQFFVNRETPEAWAALEDDFVLEVAFLYRDYWVNSLMAPDTLESNESALASAVDTLMEERGIKESGDDAFERLEIAIRSRGWGFQGGRTSPLQDFMLWRTTDTRDYEVTLTDRVQTVKVNFLDDFISFGWANFATFGHSGTGGWATDDGLYCIRAHYPDLESSSFRISYLAHEARHFADYGLYPELKQTDLEYRAKLTQLVYGQDEQQAYLEQFRGYANGESTAPHPRANWQVLSDLGSELELDPWNQNAFDAVSQEDIAATAMMLLERDSERLDREAAAKPE